MVASSRLKFLVSRASEAAQFVAAWADKISMRPRISGASTPGPRSSDNPRCPHLLCKGSIIDASCTFGEIGECIAQIGRLFPFSLSLSLLMQHPRRIELLL